MEAIGHREAFRLNSRPSHFMWQDLGPVSFMLDFKDRIYHVDCKDAKRQVGNGRNGRLGSHLAWADPRRDRKSTRLNSSHANISYAVFCLKKKTSLTRAGSPPWSSTPSPHNHYRISG